MKGEFGLRETSPVHKNTIQDKEKDERIQQLSHTVDGLMSRRNVLQEKIGQLQMQLSGKNKLNVYLEQQCKMYIASYEQAISDFKSQKDQRNVRQKKIECELESLREKVRESQKEFGEVKEQNRYREESLKSQLVNKMKEIEEIR